MGRPLSTLVSNSIGNKRRIGSFNTVLPERKIGECTGCSLGTDAEDEKSVPGTEISREHIVSCEVDLCFTIGKNSDTI